MTQDRMVTVAVGTKTMVSDAEVHRVYDGAFKASRRHPVAPAGHELPFPPGATEAQKEEMKKKAEAIMAELKGGASFRTWRRNSPWQEKDVGWSRQSDLDPKLAEFLGRLKPKEVAPALTPQGHSADPAGGTPDRRSPTPLKRWPRRFVKCCAQKEMEKQFHEWVKTLREKAHIKIML